MPPLVTPAAEFRDRVQLLKPMEGTNPTGESIEEYCYADTVAAAIKPLASRELVRAKAAEVQTTHRIIIRYHREIRSTWRVKWTDPRGSIDEMEAGFEKWRTGRILGIVETVRRRELELSVVEVTDE